MGLGIGIFLKGLAPLALYVSGWICAFIASVGRMRLGLMLVAFLLPLRNVIERIQPYPLGNQFIDIILIGVIIGSFMIADREGSKGTSRISPVALIMVIYMLVSLLRGGIFLFGSVSFDIHDSRVQDWKNFSLMPLLFFLNFKDNTNKKQVWIMFAVMCLAILVEDLYLVRQIGLHPALLDREKIRGTFQFLGPNEVAGFINECMLVLTGVFYGLRKGRNKWILLGIIVICAYCVTFLYSRGAYAGLMAGLFVLFFFKDKKMLIPLVLIVALWQQVLPQNVVDRIKLTTENGTLDESSQRRIDIWEEAFDYFKSNPIVGIGFGSFRRLGLDLKDTHNIYIKILTEQGVIGLIIFLVLVLTFLKEGWALYTRGDDNLSKGLGIGFFCAVIVMMVNNLFGDRWSYLEPNAYLWIFAGLVARLKVISSRPLLNDEKPLEPSAQGARLARGEVPKLKRKIRYYDPPDRC